MSADSPIEAEKLIELANWLRMMGEDCGVHSADRDRLLQSSSALQHLSSQVEGLKGERDEARASMMLDAKAQDIVRRAAALIGTPEDQLRRAQDAEARAQASARLLEAICSEFAQQHPLIKEARSLLVLIERGKRSFPSVDESAASACGLTDQQRNCELEEATAEAIYNGWSDHPGWVPWVPRGNSDKQEEARRLARQVPLSDGEGA